MNDAIDYMAAKGRAPSFNIHGGVRGFRSRPGAPMADPTQNKGAIGLGTLAGTPQSNWDSMFRNRVTGETPSSLAAARNGTPPITGATTASPIKTAIDTIMAGQPDIAVGSQPGQQRPPSLDTLAAGGPTHQQLWGSYSLTTANGLTGTDTPALGGTQRTLKNKYGWGSSFIPNA